MWYEDRRDVYLAIAKLNNRGHFGAHSLITRNR
jgi:hypothetical protein